MRTILILLTAVSLSASTPEYTIVTVAGNGVEGFAGDGGNALCASLNRPTAVDVDGRGFIYIADFSNNRIRRVSPDGTITTVAGSGEAGFDGDGGSATRAKLSGPYGVRVDGDGFLVVDSRNNRIRRVDANGLITTVASGFDYPVDVVRGPDGALYVAEGSGSRVKRIAADGSVTPFAGSGKRRYNGENGYSGDGGPAIDAQLNVAASLAFDRDGNLFIGDLRNHVVRRVDRNGIITTVAGTGVAGDAGDGGSATSAQLREPGGLAFEPDGSLLIAEIPRVRRLKDGVITTIAGSTKRGFYGDHGPATAAQLSVLDIIAADGEGNIFVADHRNSRIRKLIPVRAETTSAPARQPASPDVESLLQRMRSAYQSIRSAEMRFTTRSRFNQIDGSLEYRHPAIIHAVLKTRDHGVVRVVSDGTTITVEDPTQPAPESRPWTLQDMRRAIAANLEVINLWDSERQLSTGAGGNMTGSNLSIGKRERWKGKEWLILEERAGANLFRYYIDPKTALQWRTVATQADGTVFYDAIIEKLRVTSRQADARGKT